MKTVDQAIMFAKAAHQNQMRDDGVTPYYIHLLNVAQNLRDHGILSEQVLAAAVLHDIIEDTSWSYHDVAKEFGAEVAELVRHCSDDTRLPSVARFNEMLDHVLVMPFNAMLIKLADILDNVGDMSTWKPKRRQRYLEKKQRVLNAMRDSGTGVHNHGLYMSVQYLIVVHNDLLIRGF